MSQNGNAEVYLQGEVDESVTLFALISEGILAPQDSKLVEDLLVSLEHHLGKDSNQIGDFQWASLSVHEFRSRLTGAGFNKISAQRIPYMNPYTINIFETVWNKIGEGDFLAAPEES